MEMHMPLTRRLSGILTLALTLTLPLLASAAPPEEGTLRSLRAQTVQQRRDMQTFDAETRRLQQLVAQREALAQRMRETLAHADGLLALGEGVCQRMQPGNPACQ
jgi:hypothetical protein